MYTAKVKVSKKMLVKLLFPKDTQIMGAVDAVDEVQFVIKHPHLPDTKPGWPVPEVELIQERKFRLCN